MNKMKNEKYEAVGTIPKSNWKIVETVAKLTQITQICNEKKDNKIKWGLFSATISMSSLVARKQTLCNQTN